MGFEKFFGKKSRDAAALAGVAAISGHVALGDKLVMDKVTEPVPATSTMPADHEAPALQADGTPEPITIASPAPEKVSIDLNPPRYEIDQPTK